MERKIQILLIEDDPDDVELLQEALSEKGVGYEMEVIREGNAALAYFGADPARKPDIIILDFNLPKVHGRELIQEIRNREVFREIPLLILSTSSSQSDIEYAYQSGATNYRVKPATLEAINEMVQSIIEMAGGKMQD